MTDLGDPACVVLQSQDISSLRLSHEVHNDTLFQTVLSPQVYSTLVCWTTIGPNGSES